MLDQPDFNQYPIKRKRRWLSVLFLVSIVISIGSFWFGLASNTIEVNNNNQSIWGKMANILGFIKEEQEDKNYIMPGEEKERLDILILGIRGNDDPDAASGGAHLTDTIMILSYDKSTEKSAIISIPRDLYVKVYSKSEKINAAYEQGLARKEGLNYVKRLISQITGVYIDHVVVIDFSSFETIIDQVGGVDIVLAKPFVEKTQWNYEFNLPAGSNHLNGKDALYYARSRFSTNDFDRARRQQQILFALKDKLVNLDFFSDPVKTFNIFNTIRNNVNTDVGLWDIKNLLPLAGKINGGTKHHVISTDNLVYQTTIHGTYALFPYGESFDQIKLLFQNILE